MTQRAHSHVFTHEKLTLMLNVYRNIYSTCQHNTPILEAKYKPATNEWINKFWQNQDKESLSANKSNELLTHVTTRLSLISFIYKMENNNNKKQTKTSTF